MSTREHRDKARLGDALLSVASDVGELLEDYPNALGELARGAGLSEGEIRQLIDRLEMLGAVLSPGSAERAK